MRIAQSACILGFALVAAVVPAHAGTGKGVVVRLEMAGETPEATPTVELKNDVDSAQVALADRGESPDVEAGDGIYSGSTLLAGDSAQITLTIGEKVLTASAVSWDADNNQRDLTLHLDGAVLTGQANTGVPSMGQADDAPGSADLSASGNANPPTSVASSTSTSPAATDSAGSSSSGGRTYYIAAALAALAVGVVAYLALRKRGDDEGSALPPLREPGLFGGATPSTSDGLSLWTCEPTHTAEFVQQMLGALARSHRVLVVAPPEATVPPVHGGPVYRSPGVDPDSVGQAAEDLMNEGGQTLVLLVLLDPASAASLVPELPEGLGGVAVAAGGATGSLPTVTCTQADGRWTFATAAGTVHVRAGWSGFEPERTTT